MTFDDKLISISFCIIVFAIILSPEIMDYIISKREYAKKCKKSVCNKSSYVPDYVADIKLWERSVKEVEGLIGDN